MIHVAPTELSDSAIYFFYKHGAPTGLNGQLRKVYHPSRGVRLDSAELSISAENFFMSLLTVVHSAPEGRYVYRNHKHESSYSSVGAACHKSFQFNCAFDIISAFFLHSGSYASHARHNLMSPLTVIPSAPEGRDVYRNYKHETRPTAP